MVEAGCQENECYSKVLNFLVGSDGRIRCAYNYIVAIVKPSNTFELLMSYKMY